MKIPKKKKNLHQYWKVFLPELGEISAKYKVARVIYLLMQHTPIEH